MRTMYALFTAMIVAATAILLPATTATAQTFQTINHLGAVTVTQGSTYFVPAGELRTITSLDNQGGNVFVMGDLYVNGPVSNSGFIVITSDARLVVGGLLNNTGSIRPDTNSLLEIDDKANNFGTIDNSGYISGIAMNLTNYANLNNNGRIQAMGLTITNNAEFNNAGAYQGTDESFLINNANLVNSGSITNGAGNLVNNGVLNNTGTIAIHQQTYGISTLTNQAQATINNSANIHIEVGANFINSGTLSGNPASIEQAEPQPAEQPTAPEIPSGCPPGEECVIPG